MRFNLFSGVIDEEKELTKCKTFKEGLDYLKARENNPYLTLKKFRETYHPGLDTMMDMVPMMIAQLIGVAIIEALIRDEKTNRSTNTKEAPRV